MTSRRGDLPAADPQSAESDAAARPGDAHVDDAPDERLPVADPVAAEASSDGRRATGSPVVESQAIGPPAAAPPSDPRPAGAPPDDSAAAEPPSDPRGADARTADPMAAKSSSDPRPAGAPPVDSAAAEPQSADGSGAATDVVPPVPDRSGVGSPAVRPERDPFATAPLAARPPSADWLTSARPGAAGGTDVRRTESFFGEAADEDWFATSPYAAEEHAAEAPTALVDDAPTEALPVVAPAGGRHRADPEDDADRMTEWRAPRQTNMVTMGLLAALLVALGFFAGVLVGRTAGTPSSSGDTARPAATGAARPGPLR